MAIRLACTCGTEMQVEDRHAGAVVQCPRCSSIVPVPQIPIAPPVFDGPPLLQFVPKKQPRPSNRLLWMGVAWAALLAVIVVVVRLYVDGHSESPKSIVQQPPVRAPQRPAVEKSSPQLAQAFVPPPEDSSNKRVKVEAKFLTSKTSSDAILTGKVLEITNAVVQGAVQSNGKSLVFISEPGKKFIPPDVGGRISCYGNSDALRFKELKIGQPIVVFGTFEGRISKGQGFDETEVGNAKLTECVVVSLGPAPSEQPAPQVVIPAQPKERGPAITDVFVEEPPPQAIAQVPQQRAPGSKLLPVPDEVTFQRKQQALWALPEYKSKFYSLSADDWLSLSREIHDLALQEPDPNARYCEYQVAIDLALRGGNFRLAYGYAKDLTGLYQVDPIAAKRPIIDAAIRPAVTEAVTLALQLAEEAQAIGQPGPMKELLDLADTLAKPPELVRSVKDVTDYLNSLIVLSTQPDDANANLIVGRFLWLQRHEWDAGTPRLVKGNDPLLKALASMEAMRPTDPNQQFALAEHWWNAQGDVGEPERSLFNTRALDWYRIVLPRLRQDSLAYKTAKSRLAVPVDPSPPVNVKPKTAMQIKLESFFADFDEMMNDTNRQETTLQKEKRHEDLMAEIDKRIYGQTWKLQCRIIDVQETKKGTSETAYKFTFAPADDLPTLDGAWVVRQSATLTMDQVSQAKALRMRPGDYITFSGNPRLAYTASKSSTTPVRNGVNPLQSESDYLMHRDDVGDKNGTHVLSFAKVAVTLQKASGKGN